MYFIERSAVVCRSSSETFAEVMWVLQACGRKKRVSFQDREFIVPNLNTLKRWTCTFGRNDTRAVLHMCRIPISYNNHPANVLIDVKLPTLTLVLSKTHMCGMLRNRQPQP